MRDDNNIALAHGVGIRCTYSASNNNMIIVVWSDPFPSTPRRRP